MQGPRGAEASTVKPIRETKVLRAGRFGARD
jgi:hypothetical protein